MYILGIDTATKICSVALTQDDKVLAECTQDAGTTHSRNLLPTIDAILKNSGVPKKEIDLVAVSMGPGSFTGLRIGLATAEAFAYAQKKYLHGVDTLAALAYNNRQENILLSPVIDAQKGNFYQALYKWEEGKFICVENLAIVKMDEVLQRIGNEKCLLIGECAKFINLPKNVQFAPQENIMPRAIGVCALALRDFDVEKDKKIFGLEPYYIRKSEAEELWEQKHL